MYTRSPFWVWPLLLDGTVGWELRGERKRTRGSWRIGGERRQELWFGLILWGRRYGVITRCIRRHFHIKPIQPLHNLTEWGAKTRIPIPAFLNEMVDGRMDPFNDWTNVILHNLEHQLSLVHLVKWRMRVRKVSSKNFHQHYRKWINVCLLGVFVFP